MKTDGPLYFIIAVLVAMIGYHIHGSGFWTLMDFLFWPLAIVKWLICQELTLTVIKETFSFFFR